MSLYGERVAKLEERVKSLEEGMARVEDKLDQLLRLKDKGAGAFWLVSILVGSGLLAAIVEAGRWVLGK